MSTTEENKTLREQESRQVALDAGEAYRAAVNGLLQSLYQNAAAMQALDERPLSKDSRTASQRDLRTQARRLVRLGRQLGIAVTTMASALGVSRQTIHEWINKGES